MVGAVANLDQEALIRILTEPRNALIKQYARYFSFEDVELRFSEAALGAVADMALARGTGARGLRAILEEALLDVMYDLPSRTDIARVEVSEKVVRSMGKPKLVTRAELDRRAAS